MPDFCLPAQPLITLEDAAGTFAEVTVGQGGTIVDVIVNGFTGMTTGILDAVKTGFDMLVLNEAGTGLSALAIWTIVFLGIGLAPRMIRWIISLFENYKQARASK